MKFFDHLTEILKKDKRFCTEQGELLRNAIYEATMNMDERLIGLLCDDNITREKFFYNVNDVLVFDKISFSWIINNRQFLPDSYTSYKNKIGLMDSNDYISTSKDVQLVFPYKDCVLEGGQTKEDQRRKEIFYNTKLASDEIDRLLYPKVFTKAARISKDSIKRNICYNPKDNLIIKGNNLLVLSSILKKFQGKINCIYIDPPFNTHNDSFNYNDKFTRSTWLTFMKNRLTLAKKLLSDDGNIFIHIDINQSHYLKVLADEIFGENNFVEEIIWAYGSPSGGRAASPKPVNVHDYILHYSNSYSSRKQNRVYIPYSEKYIKDWFKYKDENGRLYQRRQRGKDSEGNTIWEKQYLDESKGIPLSTVWNDIKQVYADPRAYKENNKVDVEVIKEFTGGQKPEELIARILEMSTDKGDIVLDFHLGTGTTAAVAHKMNRQYIGVEQMDSQIDIIINRIKKVINGETAGISKKYNWQGGGSFVYCELKKLNQIFIDNILNAVTDDVLINIYEQVLESSYISYKVDIKDVCPNDEAFKNLSIAEKKQILIDILDKNQLYVNYCDIDDCDYRVSEEDKAFTNSFYKEVK